MMNDTTVVIVARNFLTPMDKILLTERMLHECQQEVGKLKEENKALLKLVSSYFINTQTRLDML
ncbi:unnamed protein product [Prunus brigantina]